MVNKLLYRLGSLGFRIIALQGRVWASGLVRAAHMRLRAIQLTGLGLLCLLLASGTGYAGMLLWLDPSVRPAVLCATSAVLLLIGWALISHARTLRQQSRVLGGPFSAMASSVTTGDDPFGPTDPSRGGSAGRPQEPVGR